MCKFDQNSFTFSRERVQPSYFPNFKIFCDLENMVKLTKILSALFRHLVMYLCKFGQNASIHSGDREQTRGYTDGDMDAGADSLHCPLSMSSIKFHLVIFNTFRDMPHISEN